MGRLARIKARNERIKARNEAIAKEAIAEKERIEKEVKEHMDAMSDPNHKITIEICIHCFRYQRRLCWMLSSILQQKGNLPNIVVNISHTDNDGTPTTEEVCKFFRDKGLNIKETKIPQEKIHNRAVARNIQIKQTMADYILFADSDMVYDPSFFEDLINQLKTNLKDENRVMGADRFSLNDNFCIKYFEQDKNIYPCEILDAALISSKFPVKWISGRHVAAGNFQLANVKFVKEKGSIYSGRQRDVWRATISDRQFRKRMGGRVPIKTKNMYHLNHDRGGPDIQR